MSCHIIKEVETFVKVFLRHRRRLFCYGDMSRGSTPLHFIWSKPRSAYGCKYKGERYILQCHRSSSSFTSSHHLGFYSWRIKAIDPLSLRQTYSLIYNVHIQYPNPAPPPLSSICYLLRGDRCGMAIKVYLPVCHHPHLNSFVFRWWIGSLLIDSLCLMVAMELVMLVWGGIAVVIGGVLSINSTIFKVWDSMRFGFLLLVPISRVRSDGERPTMWVRLHFGELLWWANDRDTGLRTPPTSILNSVQKPI